MKTRQAVGKKKKTQSSLAVQREIAKLKKSVRELTRERDLYRREWQKAMEDVVPLKMTQAEANAIRRDNITLDSVLKEIEGRLPKKRPA